MQVEELKTDATSLIQNRDEIIGNLKTRISELRKDGNQSKAIEEFKREFLIISSLSGSISVINEYASREIKVFEQLLSEIIQETEVLIGNGEKQYFPQLVSLKTYSIYLSFTKILIDKDDKSLKENMETQISHLELEIDQSTALSTDFKKETLFVIEFFKVVQPTEEGFFNAEFYEKRNTYISRYHEFLQSGSNVVDNITHSNLCSNLGGILLEDNLEQAIDLLENGLKFSQNAKAPELLNRSLTMLGHYYRLTGQLAVSLDYYTQCIELEDVPHLLWGYPIRHIGEIMQTRGELDNARLYYEKSLELFEFIKNQLGVARTYQYIGNIHFLQAEFELAIRNYEDSFAIVEKIQYQRIMVDVQYSFIRLYLHIGQPDKAHEKLLEMQEIHDRIRHKGIDQVYHLSKALILKESKRRVKKAKAHELLEEIVNQETINHLYTIVAMQNLCELLVDEMRTEPAEEIFVEANELVGRLYNLGLEQELYQVQIQALILQSQFDMVQGKFDETLQKLSEAEEMCRQKDLPQLTAYVTQFREKYLAEFSKWRNIVHDNESVQDRLANPEVQEYIRLALATVQEEKQQTETLLQTVLPSEIIPHLKNTTEIYAEKFEKVSILFADIVGFTKISAELDPHDMVLLLNEIFTMFDTLLPKYDVEKIRTIGDNYMVVVGAPRRCENPSRLMAKFALEISEYLNANVDALRGITFRIGMNTGEVVAGVVGTDRYHFDVWGDAVNVAARMESNGIPGKIQVTENVYNDLKEEFDFEERGVIEIKGKEPVNTWFLLGPK